MKPDINRLTNHLMKVSPGLTAGSGLKQPVTSMISMKGSVSPGLTAGSGLKHHQEPRLVCLRCISRLNRWERIETFSEWCRGYSLPVSPGLTAGSGLKLAKNAALTVRHAVSPGLTAGSGLKQYKFTYRRIFQDVSPGLTAGSGLKH